MSLLAEDYNSMISKAENDLASGVDNQLVRQENASCNVSDGRAEYEAHMNEAIRIRTNYETRIAMMSDALYKLPSDIVEKLSPALAKLPDAVKEKIKKAEPFVLKDFVPELYNLEHRNRKNQAEQIFTLNKFVQAWEDVRKDNERQVRECFLELKQKNL